MTKWDASYDVVVLGFGGAGATAARFAADDGAKVLLVDSAPEGHEGGNTRYSAQLIGTSNDVDETKKYYKKLTAPLHLDEEMIDTFVQGMAKIPTYVEKYLGVKPLSMRETMPQAKSAFEEFPEYSGSSSYDFTTVDPAWFNAALWNKLKEEVTKRSDEIDILYNTPARHLIQDPKHKTIVGVVIEHEHVLRNIQAKNGVVMAMGGFENNQRYIEDYLGASDLAPLGTLYNHGDGIRMAQEVCADMWHMNNFESLGLMHGLAFRVGKNERARLMLAGQNDAVAHGSSMVIGDDGTRYFNEAEENRHGHIKNHGQWKVPLNQARPYLIFDETKKKELDNDRIIGSYGPYKEQLVHAHSIKGLAEQINVDEAVLSETINRFNEAATTGNDAEFHRNPETLKELTGRSYYAVPLVQTVLNTQGGPRRNSRAEVLDTAGQPIKHLYSAGEFGGICANQYQGGGNLAECLIFGKIAGQNAAKVKEECRCGNNHSHDSEIKPTFKISNHDKEEFITDKDQSIGHSPNGIGGEIVVRVTASDDKINQIEVVKESETPDLGGKALAKLPDEMVKANSVDVDAISGATVTSKALKEAVKDALDKQK